MARVECSCGGENEKCFKCDGRGWYDDCDDRDPLKDAALCGPSYYLPAAPKNPSTPHGRRRRSVAPVTEQQTTSLPPRTSSEQESSAERRSSRRSPHKPGVGAHVAAGEQLYVYSGGDRVLCLYSAESYRAAQIPRVVSIILERVRKSVPYRKPFKFRDQYQVRRVSLRGDLNATVVLLNRFTTQLVPIEVNRRGAPRFLRRVDFLGEKGDNIGHETPSDLRALERSLDATRDYWQIRDGGQFGSHPSHDDYDE